MFAIYRAINSVNGKSYVGFTSKSSEKRWKVHRYLSLRGSKQHIHCALRKYGAENFKLEVLEEGWNPEIGKNIREPYWISALKPEYNMTDGGEGVTQGTKHTEEQNTLKSKRMKIVCSKEEWKLAASIRMLGRQNRKGTKQSDKWKKEHSEFMIGKRYSLGMRYKQATTTCPHCQKTGGMAAMKRWHLENCREKV
jgi:group I intron endonuclease